MRMNPDSVGQGHLKTLPDTHFFLNISVVITLAFPFRRAGDELVQAPPRPVTLASSPESSHPLHSASSRLIQMTT